MGSKDLEKAAHKATIISAIATVVASIVAVAAIGFGYQQFSQGHELERESKAVELFVKYNELMKETPSNAEPNFWRDNLSVGIAESIFKLRRGDEGWEKTVRWMLSNHTEFLKREGLNCDTFDDDFEKVVNEEIKQDVCRHQ
jgi:hypothetical protein